MTGKIRVLIVDDQDGFREGLRFLLNNHPDIEVTGVACDGAEAVHMAQYLHPEVVLMDIMMPVLSGIEATRLITQQFPDMQVISLSAYDADDWVFKGVRSGAQGYLMKGSGTEAVVESIRAVHRGESLLDPAIARKVLDEFRRSVPSIKKPIETEQPFRPLTERENEILELIAHGMNNREIALKLCLTEGTIRNHSSRILSKLHAYDRTQAVIKAAQRGIVKL